MGSSRESGTGSAAGVDEFIRQAALGEVMHNDDTGMRILRLAREPDDARTGIFTSGIVSLSAGLENRPVLQQHQACRERIWRRY